MNLKKVALSLLVSGSILAVGCGDDDSSSSNPSGTILEPDVPTCTLNGDGGTRTFNVTGLRIPANNAVGFNVDGIVSSSTDDLAGCKKTDGVPGGIDNALAEIIAGLSDLLEEAQVDINAELQGAVDDDAIDLQVTLGDWNMTATDACVSVRISGMSGGATVTPIMGNAALTNNRVDQVAFGSSIRIVPVFQLSADGGIGGPSCTDNCVPIELPITIKGLRARLVFNDTQTALVMAEEGSESNSNSTLIAGYVRYSGAEQDSFKPGLDALVAQIGTDLGSAVDPIFAQFLDLDSTPGPGLSACTSLGGTQTSADTFSAGIVASATAAP